MPLTQRLVGLPVRPEPPDDPSRNAAGGAAARAAERPEPRRAPAGADWSTPVGSAPHRAGRDRPGRGASAAGGHSRASRAALVLLMPLLGALAGCQAANQNEFPPSCPRAGLLHDADELTRFDPRGQDLTDMVLDAHITNMQGKCEWGPHDDSVAAELVVDMVVTRGPAAPEGSRSATVPYFVAVTRGEQILDKHVYTLGVVFPPNIDTVHLSGTPVKLLLPVGGKRTGASYRVLIGFQLTPAELALNRARNGG